MKALIDITTDGLDVSLNRYGNYEASVSISYRDHSYAYVYDIDLAGKLVVESHIDSKEGLTYEQHFTLNCVHAYEPCVGVCVTLWYDLANNTLYITDKQRSH